MTEKKQLHDAAKTKQRAIESELERVACLALAMQIGEFVKKDEDVLSGLVAVSSILIDEEAYRTFVPVMESLEESYDKIGHWSLEVNLPKVDDARQFLKCVENLCNLRAQPLGSVPDP